MSRSSRIGPVAVAAAALGGAALLASCSYYPYHCENYSECEGGDGDACPGQCVPLPPFDFSGPALLWIGKEVDAPDCPDRATEKVYEGFAELYTGNDCPACNCTAPACVLPAGVTVSTLSVCPNDGPGATLTAFDAPESWDGTCTSPKVVPANLVGSITVAPATRSPCQPYQQVPTSSPGPWGQVAFACAGEAIPNACPSSGETCMPTAEPPPPGFLQCIFYNRDGDTECPAKYPDKHVFYSGLDDTRGCTPCECTETAPSHCSAFVSSFADTSCTSVVAGSMVEADPICTDVAPGATLGSISAMWLDDDAGTCAASGGEAFGDVKPINSRTFCCQPPPG